MRRRQEQERRQRLAADEAAAARRQQQEWLVVAVDEAVRAQRVLARELDCAQRAQSAERRVGRGPCVSGVGFGFWWVSGFWWDWTPDDELIVKLLSSL